MNNQEIVEQVLSRFDEIKKKDKTIRDLEKAVRDGVANYENMHLYSESVGNALKQAWLDVVGVEILPNGVMYEDLAKQLLDPTVFKNYQLVTDYFEKAETLLYKKQGLGLSPPIPPYNQDMTNGLVTLVSGLPYEDNVETLTEALVTNAMKVMDDSIKGSLQFQDELGLTKQVRRKLAPSEIRPGKKGKYGKYEIPCKLCKEYHNQVYEYKYPYNNLPPMFWARHESCRCQFEILINGQVLETNRLEGSLKGERFVVRER